MSYPANLAVGGVSKKEVFFLLGSGQTLFFPRNLIVFRCYRIKRWKRKQFRRKQNILIKLYLLLLLAPYSILF